MFSDNCSRPLINTNGSYLNLEFVPLQLFIMIVAVSVLSTIYFPADKE